MPFETNDPILFSLKKLVNYCEEIESLLKKDKECFANNNLIELNGSNERKAILLYEIEQIAHQLKIAHGHVDATDLSKSIEFSINQLDVSSQQEARKMLTSLKPVLTKCYQSLMINNNIVYTGLRQLKNIWDRLLDAKSSPESLYDQTGGKVE